MGRFAVANDILNAVSVEVGLQAVTDPVGSTSEEFTQLTQLLTTSGQELVQLHDWPILTKSHQIVTTAADSGRYPLPSDFSHIINQTGWERSNRTPLGGPLSPQDWTYLAGRDLVSDSIYASFRMMEGIFALYPQDPVPAGLDINFEYQSINWVLESDLSSNKDAITSGTDIVLLDPLMVKKFVKAKWLEAKGFDASSARLEFENMFQARAGNEAGSSVLSASQNQRGFPYLTPYRNLGDSKYGL